MRQKPTNYDLSHVGALARRRSNDKRLSDMIMKALKHPDIRWAKHTASGIMLAGPNGTAACHFTNSDRRAIRNFEMQLRQAGLLPPRKA